MGLVVYFSVRFKINPDNVATPIAAALGDLVTLSLFSGIGSLLYYCISHAVCSLFVDM
jgi:solute carrier family 41